MITIEVVTTDDPKTHSYMLGITATSAIFVKDYDSVFMHVASRQEQLLLPTSLGEEDESYLSATLELLYRSDEARKVGLDRIETDLVALNGVSDISPLTTAVVLYSNFV